MSSSDGVCSFVAFAPFSKTCFGSGAEYPEDDISDLSRRLTEKTGRSFTLPPYSNSCAAHAFGLRNC
jgi:hypothetical protein